MLNKMGIEMDKKNSLSRRSFVYSSAACAAGTLALKPWLGMAAAGGTEAIKGELYGSIKDGLPAKPIEQPLPWRSIADTFDSYIMQSSNQVLIHRPGGSACFVSALEGKSDGGLTTFGPILMGKILRNDDVSDLISSFAGYFNEEAGIFLDSVDADLCEYWYLMNINALAVAIIRSKLSDDPKWLGKVRSSCERLIALAQQIKYDFNDQGYNFKEHRPFTKQDIYRQPDAIAGYSYLMLFAHEFLGDEKFAVEARIAIARYQSFQRNPWYEIPSGAMGSLAAARLSTLDQSVDLHKILGFVLASKVGLMHTGTWGGKEVNGLMSGFGTEPPDQVYSMESMVVLPYLLPVLRYRPEYANDIGKYALNTLANMRWFYPNYLPLDLQDRPELSSAFPYERLSKSEKGHSPYASGDYDSHRSVYGGAYALWLGEIVMPTTDKYILQIDISRTDFLAAKSFPTFLYYNPWDGKRSVIMNVGGNRTDVYDLYTHRMVFEGVTGSIPVSLDAHSSRILVSIPSGKKRSITNGVLYFDDTPVDYSATQARLRTSLSQSSERTSAPSSSQTLK